MVYEDERIYPPSLGKKIRPDYPSWGSGKRIANIPSAAAAGETGFLPQLFKEVRPIGKHGEWFSLANRPSVHEVSHFSQTVRGAIRERVNVIRGRMMSRQIIPPAWGPKRWGSDAPIANLPAVIGIGMRNTRTMHPSVNKGEERTNKVDGSQMSISGDLEPMSMDLGKDFSITY